MNSICAVGRTVILFTVIWASPGLAQTWTQTGAPITNWTAVACSANGSRVVAAAGASIYASSDSGQTWSVTSTLGTDWKWTSFAASADGATWMASSQDSWDSGAVYVSTNAGFTWVLTYTDSCCTSVACSGDARSVAVGVRPPIHGFGGVEISHDSGASWSYSMGSPHMCVAVAGSADGRTLAAVGNDFVYAIPPGVSIDAGVSWVPGPASLWSGLACAGDGRTIFATTGTSIYRSTNWGAAWDSTSSPAASIACSADGSRVLTAAGTAVYTSTDSGTTWVSNSLPALSWTAVASSADGQRLFAAAKGDGIYTLQTTPAPVLRISWSGNTLQISWVVPSRELVLQESAALTSWSAPGAIPALNYTNLHHEVSLPAPTSPRFYRLVAP
jgi:hypothetical protein